MTTNPITEAVLEAVARAICVACEENPDHRGDARGNEFRWQDYHDAALAAISALTAAQQQGQATPPSTPMGMKTLSEFMAEQEALHPGINDKVQAAADELRAEVVRPKREDECLTLDHWRMRAYYLEENWSRCSRACAVEQTKRERAEARAERMKKALRLIESAKDRGFGIDYARGVAQSILLHDQEEGNGQ